MRYLIAISIFFLAGCVYDKVQLFTVQNNTDSVLYVSYSLNDSLPLMPAFYLFDTFNLNGKDTITYSEHRLDKFSIGVVTDFQDKSQFKPGVYLFYIQEDIMKTKKWDEIVKYQLYTKRVYYSYDSLIKNDFQVEYP